MVAPAPINMSENCSARLSVSCLQLSPTPPRKNKEERRKIMPKIVATTFCLQHLRGTQAVPSDLNKFVFQKLLRGSAFFVGLSMLSF